MIAVFQIKLFQSNTEHAASPAFDITVFLKSS